MIDSLFEQYTVSFPIDVEPSLCRLFKEFFVQLLDWTGRQIRSHKRGAMPANLEPLFERLGISTELWVDCVLNFRKWFRSSVGRPKSMEAAAETRGHNRAISINSARRAFAS